MLRLALSFKPFFSAVLVEKMKACRYSGYFWANSKWLQTNHTFLYIKFILVQAIIVFYCLKLILYCLYFSKTLNIEEGPCSNISISTHNIKLLPHFDGPVILISSPCWVNFSQYLVLNCLIEGSSLGGATILSGYDDLFELTQAISYQL